MNICFTVYCQAMGNNKPLSIGEAEEIIRRLKSDDKFAVDELFNCYYSRLYHFSKSILKIDNGIDDILQDVFVKIWLNRHRIGSAETFNAFIFTITKNAVLNLIRANLKEHSLREEIYLRSVAEEYQTQNSLEFDEIKEAIDKIVTTLPEKRQLVFKLSRTEGLPNKEIANQLGISEKTVEDHITHAIRHIKDSLTEMGVLSILYFYLFL